MKKVLIICYSLLHRDPRVLTQFYALNNNFNITLGGFSTIQDCEKFIEIKKPNRTFIEKLIYYMTVPFGLASLSYWNKSNKKNLQLLKQANDIDILIANDLDILPIAAMLKGKNTFLVFDAHEYYPSSGQANGIKRYIKKKYNKSLLKSYLWTVNKMVTVAPSIKNLYFKNFGKNPTIIMNLPDQVMLKPNAIDPNNVKLVHHGAALPNRKLELMIETMDYLDKSFSLTFYLVVSEHWEEYFESLKAKAVKSNTNIYFNKPVKTKEISSELNKFDIGFFLLPPKNLNYLYALPNKLFEFIQSRLAIVIGPSYEMKKIVEKYNLGIVGDNFNPFDLAKKIESTSIDQYANFKRNSDSVSKELNSNLSKRQWLKLVER